MSKHTPGPWKVLGCSFEDTENDKQCWYLIEAENMVADKSNANLIAAAPELLRVLKDMVDGCHYCEGTGEVPTAGPPTRAFRNPNPCFYCMEARNIIAEGESP